MSRIVAIVGRPNVGKSTLFNRMVGRRLAIVDDEPGITRDRCTQETEWRGETFTLIDTGGFVENPEDPIVVQTRAQAEIAIAEADVIIFLTDAQAGLNPADREVSEALRRSERPTLLVANKADDDALEQAAVEFYELGLDDPIPISATHGRGVGDLLDRVLEILPEESETEKTSEGVVKVAIVGRPNAGKSSLVNALLRKERVIVDSRPGTTRDAVDIPFKTGGKEFLLIDTAGLRKKARIRTNIEYYTVNRALRAIRRADVSVLLLDSLIGLTEQDCRVAGYIKEEGKPILLAFNKWDLIENREEAFKKVPETIRFTMPFLSFAPFICVSALTRQRIPKIFQIVSELYEESRKRVGTSQLNRCIEKAVAKHHPPTKRGKQAKIFYATQAQVAPPTFIIFVNQLDLFHFSYLRYLENRFREDLEFSRVPIKIRLRQRRS